MSPPSFALCFFLCIHASFGLIYNCSHHALNIMIHNRSFSLILPYSFSPSPPDCIRHASTHSYIQYSPRTRNPKLLHESIRTALGLLSHNADQLPDLYAFLPIPLSFLPPSPPSSWFITPAYLYYIYNKAGFRANVHLPFSFCPRRRFPWTRIVALAWFGLVWFSWQPSLISVFATCGCMTSVGIVECTDLGSDARAQCHW